MGSFLRKGGKKTSPGRPALSEVLSKRAVDHLRKMKLRTDSTALSVRVFADDPLCPDELRDRFGRMTNSDAVPMSIRRAMHITPELKAMRNGPTAYQHIAFKCRHNSRVNDPMTGEERELMAGDIYLSDDMSRNRYFWFPLSDPEIETRTNRGDKLSRKYGVGLGRQGLMTMDARGKFLRLDLIGCAKDAYTSADVLRHMKATLERWGKPRLSWILEKGCWAAEKVDGKRIWVPEEERTKTVAGLGNLGFEVNHVHTSEGKALLEGAFNHLQSLQAAYGLAPDIGRRRGEMERETKLIQRIQNGTLHPADGGLESIEEATANDIRTLVYFNGEVKCGAIQKGVPDDNWIQDTQRHPTSKLAISEKGFFMPIKLETEIRHGCLSKKIGGTVFRFTMPELFGQLGHGYRLMFAFDDSNPAAGAEVYNLETGSKNMHGWKQMEYVGHAEWEADRLFFGYSDQTEESQERKKRHHRGVMTSGADTGYFGKRAMSEVESRDGRGNVAAMTRGDFSDAPTRFGEQADSDNAGRVHASPADESCPDRSGREVCPAVTTGGDPAGRADARPLSGRAECSSPPRRDSGHKKIVLDRFALVEA
jgi:hypothetical protein